MTVDLDARPAGVGDETAFVALVARALELWVEDAVLWLTRGDRLRGGVAHRCEEAWVLLERRPRRVPLIDAATLVANVEEEAVWRWLYRQAIRSAGLEI